MNFPTTTEEFLKTFAHGKEPTSEDREYAEGQGTKREQPIRTAKSDVNTSEHNI